MRKLIIPGEPVAQGRPRFCRVGGFVRAYDPDKSRRYKELVRLVALRQWQGLTPLEGPLALSLLVYRAIPKGFAKKQAQAAAAGELRPITRPDLDNYLKGLKDALKGLAWHDDSQVVAYAPPFGKFYAQNPRVELTVWQLETGADERREE